MSGGIRDDESLAAAMATGCRRVNIGTAALEQPEWCAAAIASTATGWPSASTYAGGRSPPAAGPARAATSTRCWPGSTPRAARATSSPTSTRTACSRAPTSTCCATSAPPPTARSWPPAASPSSPTSRALQGLVADGRRGRDHRHRALRGPVHPRGRARADPGRPMTPRRPRHPVPRRRRRPGGQGHQLPGAARRRRPGRAGPEPTTRRAPTSSPSSTSPPRTRAGPPPWRSSPGPPSRSSSRSPSAAECPRSTTSTGCCGPAPTRSRSTPPPSSGPELVAEIADRFGNQVLVLSVDARRAAGTDSGFEVTTHGGRKSAGLDAIAWAARGAELGAGEILLNAMDADGTRGRLRPRPDPRRPARRSRSRSSPPAAPGGPSTSPPAVDAGADAVLAATVFHFGTLRIGEVKAALAAAGHPGPLTALERAPRGRRRYGVVRPLEGQVPRSAARPNRNSTISAGRPETTTGSAPPRSTARRSVSVRRTTTGTPAGRTSTRPDSEIADQSADRGVGVQRPRRPARAGPGGGPRGGRRTPGCWPRPRHRGAARERAAAGAGSARPAPRRGGGASRAIARSVSPARGEILIPAAPEQAVLADQQVARAGP